MLELRQLEDDQTEERSQLTESETEDRRSQSRQTFQAGMSQKGRRETEQKHDPVIQIL